MMVGGIGEWEDILVAKPLNDWVIFFQNVISFFDAVHPMRNNFIWNWSNTVIV